MSGVDQELQAVLGFDASEYELVERGADVSDYASPREFIREGVLRLVDEVLDDGGQLPCPHEDCERSFATRRQLRGHLGSSEHALDVPTTDTERFEESHNLKYGVVKDEMPESDVYRHDENTIFITQFEEDGAYSLHLGSCVGTDSTIYFDSLRWSAEEYGGTLWFEREVGDETVTTANLDWSAAFPTTDYGLVGEWFLEQIDLSPHRADVECPECGGELLHLPMSTGCEEPDCDFFCEGHLVEDDRDV